MCHAQIQLDPASPPQAVRQVQGGVYSSRITRARLQKLYTVSLLGNTTEEVALFLFFFFFLLAFSLHDESENKRGCATLTTQP